MHARALIRAHVMSLFNNIAGYLWIFVCRSSSTCNVTNNNICCVLLRSGRLTILQWIGGQKSARSSVSRTQISFPAKKRKEVLLRPTSVDRHVYSMTTRCRPCMECKKKRSGRRNRTSSTVHCRMQVFFLAGWVFAGCRIAGNDQNTSSNVLCWILCTKGPGPCIGWAYSARRPSHKLKRRARAQNLAQTTVSNNNSA